MGVHLGGTLGGLGTTYCYSCARGGPALRQDTYLAPWAGINGDDRKALTPYMWFNWRRADRGRTTSASYSPELHLRLPSRFSSALSLNYSRNPSDRHMNVNMTATPRPLHCPDAL